MLESDITEDAILGGRVRLRQPTRGYRVNVDTILLAAAIEAPRRAIELGCGVGGALLAAAARAGACPARYLGVERDAAFAALARANVALNGFEDRVEILEGDVLDPPADLAGFDAVFFNPPYAKPGEGRPPSPARQGAHMAEGPIGDWIKLWCNRMAGDGVMTIIHKAQRLPELLAALEGRLGGIEAFPIRPAPGAGAHRVVVRARKGSRAPFRLWEGLDLHPNGAPRTKYTPVAEAILRGERGLWGPD